MGSLVINFARGLEEQEEVQPKGKLVTTLARGESLARHAVELHIFASCAAMSSQIVKTSKR